MLLDEALVSNFVQNNEMYKTEILTDKIHPSPCKITQNKLYFAQKKFHFG